MTLKPLDPVEAGVTTWRRPAQLMLMPRPRTSPARRAPPGPPTKLGAAHAAGEEWYDLDRPLQSYNPAGEDDVLRAARRRIQEVRTREAEVRFVDRSGRPCPGLVVDARMQRHAFPFGEQLWALDAMARDGEWDTGRARAWRQRFEQLFNAANNLCYWTERPQHDASKVEERQGDWRLENFARTVEWTRARGMLAKGHPLFWSIPKCVPDWVQRYDVATQMKFAEVRVRNLVARFRGQVTLWDAVNEPLWEAAPGNFAAREWPHIEPLDTMLNYIEPVLRWCREEDPEARFLVNDYGMEADYPHELRGSDGSRVTAGSQRRRYVELVRGLQDRGVSPDGIGLQSHTGWIAHAQQSRIYDEFAATGLPVHITEFWAETKALRQTGRFSDADLEVLQAEYVANYLTCAFGHPAIESFFFWGFLNSAISWTERSGHVLKPLWQKVHGLIHDEWSTRVQRTTDADGVIRFRGFLGDYALRIPWGGSQQRGFALRLDRMSPPVQTVVV
jgi:endo-1,4-beta-xylanase